MVAVVASNQMTTTNKFQAIKYRFTSLRENLTTVIEFLNEIQDRPEDQIQYYQIMKIKTNFFIDEIDFHLRGDVNAELLKEYCAVYANFYHRSRNEVIETLNEIFPNRQVVW